MKFLEDDKLAQLTADLTDATLVGCHGGSRNEGTSRILNGRIEAYTTKRVSSDKKYAHALGEAYIKEIDQVEEEMAKFQKSLGLEDSTGAAPGEGGRRIRAGSIDEWKRNKFGVNKADATSGNGKSGTKRDESRDTSTSPKLTGKSGPGGSRAGRKPDKPEGVRGSRRRSQSVDIGGIAKAAAASSAKVTISTEPTEPSRTSSSSSSNKDQPLTSIMKPKGGGRYRSSSFDTSRARSSSSTDALHSHGYFSNSSLGDFHEMGTRRLMTDLILTLNASFPDYDFGSVRPDHFIRLSSATAAINRVNERLSEFAATLPANTHGYGRSMMDGAGYGYGRENGSVFLQKLWAAIDDVIVLNDCEVYSYVPPVDDNDDDPLGFLTETLAPGGAGGGGPAVNVSNGTSSGAVAATATRMATSVVGSSGLEAVSDPGVSSQQSAEVSASRSGNTAFGASMPLWTFNYFFVNKSLKRIVLFACVQTMQNDATMDMDEDMDDVSGAERILSPSRIAASADADANTPSRYGYDDVESPDSPPTGIARGGGGGTRRQLLGVSASSGRMTDGGGVSGYYSMSSTDARTDEEFDEFDTGNLAEDVGRPATPGTPVSVS